MNGHGLGLRANKKQEHIRGKETMGRKLEKANEIRVSHADLELLKGDIHGDS